jgi:hypothetical protein
MSPELSTAFMAAYQAWARRHLDDIGDERSEARYELSDNDAWTESLRETWDWQ